MARDGVRYIPLTRVSWSVQTETQALKPHAQMLQFPQGMAKYPAPAGGEVDVVCPSHIVYPPWEHG